MFMFATKTFWRRARPAADGDGTTPTSAERIQTMVIPVLDSLPRDSNPSAWDAILPWRRRAAELRARSERAVELLESLQTHLESQGKRADQLNVSIDKLSTTLAEISSSQKAGAGSLAALTEHMAGMTRHAGGLHAALLELPASLQAQAEAVRSIGRQMESGRATDTRLVESLEGIGQVVNVLQQNGRLQAEALQRASAADERQQEALRCFMREQSRRVMLVTAAAAGLVLVSLAGLALVVWRGLPN